MKKVIFHWNYKHICSCLLHENETERERENERNKYVIYWYVIDRMLAQHIILSNVGRGCTQTRISLSIISTSTYLFYIQTQCLVNDIIIIISFK